MPSDRRVNYRAIHTKNKWRKAKHDSIAHALGQKRGARALFSGKAAIDYDKQGKPLFVVVWEEGKTSGLVIKEDQNAKSEIVKAEISIAAIMRFEAAGEANLKELDECFRRNNPEHTLAEKIPVRPFVDECVLGNILTRRGQQAFRDGLLRAYNGRCAVTGCNAVAVLEAAHIVPHAEEQSYAITNGLLLRADIHTLFDLLLLSVDPETGEVKLAPDLSSCYASIVGVRLQVPDSPEEMPNPEALKEHYLRWERNIKG